MKGKEAISPEAAAELDLTQGQIQDLNTFTTTEAGLVPAPLVTKGYPLQDDGTWAPMPPKSATLTRDGNGAVATVTVSGEATWTLSRNPDESVSQMTNGTYTVTVNRDGDGIVTGITVIP